MNMQQSRRRTIFVFVSQLRATSRRTEATTSMLSCWAKLERERVCDVLFWLIFMDKPKGSRATEIGQRKPLYPGYDQKKPKIATLKVLKRFKHTLNGPMASFPWMILYDVQKGRRPKNIRRVLSIDDSVSMNSSRAIGLVGNCLTFGNRFIFAMTTGIHALTVHECIPTLYI
jgi:hypothetical protein